ncbi:DUF3267 domain-containing protein [Brevibacillus formosus]|uniref:DUF3267 domain-containing protein n=1 Tax=Brevibacillus TaxID=55080 RepID=UPI000D10E045|nr:MULTISPECIES: DUF3267 domain-containing protein [Brevibacillus]MBG9941925.1 hypothetical protein [Brevibacillus formosus]MED1945638.1 DUF3267 domain-containing protein [Brevibacillus formosus]MED2000729.1 DUF3267 domain-containing protein [Brevibacillus formosus]MED2084425.1 DUF3267 domain-containing protein [Brevibacillus formosus]PSK15694.1 DUF3267 domain-containing protein [Brevibacillus sp. NRRL NRS-603]
MRITTKLPQYHENVHVELMKNEWIPLKEPQSLGRAILLSIPFMLINGLIAFGIIHIFSPITFQEIGLTSDSLSISIDINVIFFLLGLVICHECLHLIFIPNFLKSERTWMGLTLFGGFVATEEKIPKSRYILITIAPFIILSVILPFLLGFLGLLATVLKFLILINAIASSVDMLNLFLVMKQVPKQAILISNGQKTYWKALGND